MKMKLTKTLTAASIITIMSSAQAASHLPSAPKQAPTKVTHVNSVAKKTSLSQVAHHDHGIESAQQVKSDRHHKRPVLTAARLKPVKKSVLCLPLAISTHWQPTPPILSTKSKPRVLIA
ncbi:MAG: hypothetical protein ACI9FJ_002490 [Alteromonadaceae bacterium]